MDFIEAIKPLYSLSGLAVGILVGMTGVGGGSLMTPVLILLFGVHPATAVGTDLLYAAVTKSAGTLFHGMARNIDWRIVARLAAGSVPAAALTLFLLSRVDIKGGAAYNLITPILGVALVLTALSLVFHKKIQSWQTHVDNVTAGKTEMLTVVAGAVMGALVSITSVGAGALGVTVLLALYPRLPLPRIVGSDIAHAVPLTLLAGFGHWLIGSVDMAMLGSLLIGSVPGILIGSYFAPRIPAAVLRTILAATLILVGIKLLT